MYEIIEIESLTENSIYEDLLAMYTSLSEVQLLRYYEPHGGIFIAESPKVIHRALDLGCRPISLLADRQDIGNAETSELLARLAEEPIPVFSAAHDAIKDLTGFQLTRGVLCAMHRPALPAAADILAGTRRIAVLENVMNPTNIGAIFRSAAALGIDAILLTSGCSDPFYRRAARVSMGTVFQVPWTRVDAPRAEGLLPFLREQGFATAAMALKQDSVSIDDPALMAEKKLAIILGTEGDGLADASIEGCDYTVMIPMSHNVDSLNVAAASAVAFWQLTR